MIVPAVGLPVDAAQWGALGLGVATLAFGAAAARAAGQRERAVVVGLSAAAAALSFGYWGAYLQGGPRIIDATSYWLSARALAAGHVSWPTGEPEASVLGRFLVRSEGAEGAAAAVLFPPGYPLALSVGFLVGAPWLVGLLVAAGLVVATWALGREVVRGDRALEGVPLVAAALSVVCGALRYHTADTMSHGLAALCFTGGLAMVLRACRSAREGGEGWTRRAASGRAWVWGAAGGLLGGWLFATRPASGLAWAVTVGVGLALGLDRGGRRADGAGGALDEGRGAFSAGRVRMAAAVAAGALPMVLVYVVHQRLATGQWLLSTHAASYATNDGPAGCFRYGFGEGIGCLGEHGDFVAANLPDGFGFVAAVKTTARRLWMHLVDAGNAEALALLVPAGAALGWARARVRWLSVAVLAQIAAYVPFYFDGNYPGGGARLFADVLPIEHVLIAIAAALLAARWGGDGRPEEAEAQTSAARSEVVEAQTSAARSEAAEAVTPSARSEAAEVVTPAARSEVVEAVTPAARLGAAEAVTRSARSEVVEAQTSATRPSWIGRAAGRSGAWVVGLALIGFAVRAGFDHAQLRDRDGGAPLFSMSAASELGGSTALYFVESDAAFNLTFDPRMRRAAAEARAAGQGRRASVHGLDVVRLKGDLLDTLAWQERGSPPAFIARFEVPPGAARGGTVLEAYAPIAERAPWIEGESLWPPVAQEGGAYALPIWAGGTCASQGRALRLFQGRTANGQGRAANGEASAEEGGAVRLGLPSALVAGRSLDIVVLVAAPEGSSARDGSGGSPPPLPSGAPDEDTRGSLSASSPLRVEGTVFADGRRIASAALFVGAAQEPTCASLVRTTVPDGARRIEIRLAPRWPAGRSPEAQPFVALDRVLVADASP